MPKPCPYVKLVSADGHEFVISQDAANNSRILRGMIESDDSFSPGSDSTASTLPSLNHMITLPLQDISCQVLDLLCQYLTEKSCCESMSDFKQLQNLDPQNEDDRQLVLEVLLAADYLDC